MFASSPAPSHWMIATDRTGFVRGTDEVPARAIFLQRHVRDHVRRRTQPVARSKVGPSNGRHPVARTTAPTLTLLTSPSRFIATSNSFGWPEMLCTSAPVRTSIPACELTCPRARPRRALPGPGTAGCFGNSCHSLAAYPPSRGVLHEDARAPARRPERRRQPGHHAAADHEHRPLVRPPCRVGSLSLRARTMPIRRLSSAGSASPRAGADGSRPPARGAFTRSTEAPGRREDVAVHARRARRDDDGVDPPRDIVLDQPDVPSRQKAAEVPTTGTLRSLVAMRASCPRRRTSDPAAAADVHAEFLLHHLPPRSDRRDRHGSGGGPLLRPWPRPRDRARNPAAKIAPPGSSATTNESASRVACAQRRALEAGAMPVARTTRSTVTASSSRAGCPRPRR